MPTPSARGEDAGGDAAAPPDPLSAEQREQIRAAIAKQPILTQQIFFAHRFDERNYIEIAAMTGLTIREVESEIARVIVAIDHALSEPPRRRWRRWR